MRKSSFNTKWMVTVSALIAIAMILSYLESMVPIFDGSILQGLKLGLSNIATVFALYTLGWPEAILVSALRVSLMFLLFPKPDALFLSLAGAALALTAMILLKKTNRFSTVGVSVVGGVMHNVGQIIAACLLFGTSGLALYLIPLTISGTVAGVIIGILSGNLVKRLKKYL